MTDKRRTFALAARAAIFEYFQDPENEKEFQQWMQGREAGAQHATNETRAQPRGCPAKGTVTTV